LVENFAHLAYKTSTPGTFIVEENNITCMLEFTLKLIFLRFFLHKSKIVGSLICHPRE